MTGARTNDLLERVRAFRIDPPGAEFTFAARLARENGWDEDFTRRTIDEYLKFMVLAVTAGHKVTPSEQVDRAWHLHLTYTRSYWTEFCEETLHTDVHHEPTVGGQREQVKFDDWYAKTLQSYERIFGEAPPTDIWPDAEKRFGEDIDAQWVNLRRNWVLPRPTWRKLVAPAGSTSMVALPALALAPVAAFEWNPFALGGSEFLTFYGVLYVAALALALVIRRALRTADDGATVELDLYESAFLAGGETRATSTAITRLLRQQALHIVDDQVLADGSLPNEAHELERKVHITAQRERATRFPDIVKATGPETGRIRSELEDRGLLESQASFAGARFWSSAVLLFALGIGAARVIQGLSGGHPVGYLLVWCAVVLITWICLRKTPLRTRAGNRHLESAQSDRRTAARQSEDSGMGDDIAIWGVAVLGTEFLANNGEAETAGSLNAFLGATSPSSGTVGTDAYMGDSGCAASGCGGCGG